MLDEWKCLSWRFGLSFAASPYHRSSAVGEVDFLSSSGTDEVGYVIAFSSTDTRVSIISTLSFFMDQPISMYLYHGLLVKIVCSSVIIIIL